MQRLLSAEIPVNNVIGNFADIAFVGMIFFFRTFSKQSKLIHDSLDAFVVYLKATVQKFTVYSSYAVAFPVLIEDGENFRR